MMMMICQQGPRVNYTQCDFLTLLFWCYFEGVLECSSE